MLSIGTANGRNLSRSAGGGIAALRESQWERSYSCQLGKKEQPCIRDRDGEFIEILRLWVIQIVPGRPSRNICSQAPVSSWFPSSLSLLCVQLLPPAEVSLPGHLSWGDPSRFLFHLHRFPLTLFPHCDIVLRGICLHFVWVCVRPCVCVCVFLVA